MINVKIVRDSRGNITEFTVENHGDTIVCAAVSMLVLNTVNSIDMFTEEKFTCDYNENGGFLSFKLDNPAARTEGTAILLDAMMLGLTSAKAGYPNEVEIKEMRT